MTGALALACFVKVCGVVFLGAFLVKCLVLSCKRLLIAIPKIGELRTGRSVNILIKIRQAKIGVFLPALLLRDIPWRSALFLKNYSHINLFQFLAVRQGNQRVAILVIVVLPGEQAPSETDHKVWQIEAQPAGQVAGRERPPQGPHARRSRLVHLARPRLRRALDPVRDRRRLSDSHLRRRALREIQARRERVRVPLRVRVRLRHEPRPGTGTGARAGRPTRGARFSSRSGSRLR